MSRTWAALVAMSILVPAASAVAQRGGDAAATRQVIELVAFSEDNREFVVKVSDEEGRQMWQVFSSKRTKPKAAYPWDDPEGKKAWWSVKRKHKPTGEPIPGEHPKRKITLMSAQKGDQLVIYGMKGEGCIKDLDKIRLKKVEKGKNEGKPAEAFVKQLAWSPDGDYIVAIYHEKLDQTYAWEGDSIHSFKFKQYKMSCPEPAK